MGTARPFVMHLALPAPGPCCQEPVKSRHRARVWRRSGRKERPPGARSGQGGHSSPAEGMGLGMGGFGWPLPTVLLPLIWRSSTPLQTPSGRCLPSLPVTQLKGGLGLLCASSAPAGWPSAGGTAGPGLSSGAPLRLAGRLPCASARAWHQGACRCACGRPGASCVLEFCSESERSVGALATAFSPRGERWGLLGAFESLGTP